MPNILHHSPGISLGGVSVIHFLHEMYRSLACWAIHERVAANCAQQGVSIRSGTLPRIIPCGKVHEGFVHDKFFLQAIIFCRVGFYPAWVAGVPVAAEVHVSALHDAPVV